MAWKAFKDGDIISGKIIRIMGKKNNYNEAQNLHDALYYRLPGGLVGNVESNSPYRIKFDRFNVSFGANRDLWALIAPLWKHNTMFACIDPTRYRGLEIYDEG